MVFFACQGNEIAYPAAAQNVVTNYANAGGRIFGTHYAFDWFYNHPPFSGTAVWSPNQATPTPDPQTGIINQGSARSQLLAQWLQYVGATTTVGQISLGNFRHDYNGVVAPTQEWAYLQTGHVSMHLTFDTPVGAAPASQCGRVVYEDFHLYPTDAIPGIIFPNECVAGAMTPEEKMVEVAIFDLGACLKAPREPLRHEHRLHQQRLLHRSVSHRRRRPRLRCRLQRRRGQPHRHLPRGGDLWNTDCMSGEPGLCGRHVVQDRVHRGR